jgi:hypothetical protein
MTGNLLRGLSPPRMRRRSFISLQSSKTASSGSDSDDVERRPSVSFGSIHIREYGRLLIDHPECQDGLALGLDWKHSQKDKVIGVDQYEKKRRFRGQQPCPRLCIQDRTELLIEVGGYNVDKLWEVHQERVSRHCMDQGHCCRMEHVVPIQLLSLSSEG